MSNRLALTQIGSVGPTENAADPIGIIQALKRMTAVLFLCVIVAIIFMVLEILVRLERYLPWVIHPPGIELDPPGARVIQHPTLGYVSRPISMTVKLTGAWGAGSFRLGRLPNGLRPTHPVETYSAESKPEIWIFGCSWTEGWGLEDHETFPWLLQKMFTYHEVVNFGVAGYSTVQSLIQMREALQGGRKPDIAVLTYGSWHDERNCLARSWFKHAITYGATLKKNALLPYVKVGRDNEPVILYKKFRYHPTFLLRHSALVNLLDQK